MAAYTYALVLAVGFVNGPGAVFNDTQEQYETLLECRAAAKQYTTGPGVKPKQEGRCFNIRDFYIEPVTPGE